MNRRRFLRLSAAGTAAAAVTAPVLWFRRTGLAAPFGEFPAEASSALLPEAVRAESVLEIFMYGGLSPWETLYMVEEYGTPSDPEFPNQQYYTFLGSGNDSLENALSDCGFPDGEPHGVSFATDALGADVKIGPFAYQLRQRQDLLDRMRLLVQRHALEPHEAAVPQALTGRPVGQPSAAGLGSHIQRFFADRDGTGRASPFSYVFATGGISADNVSAAASTGVHPGHARPLRVTITNAERFAELLDRAAVGDRAARDEYDALMGVYVAEYRQRLRFAGAGDPVRSARLTDLSRAVESVGNVDAISTVMDPSLFVDRPGDSCGANRSFDVPGMSLNAARHLLTHPTDPARYVCVSDIGLFEASGGGGYDTHTGNSQDTAMNFANLMKNLSAVVNAPGENDPTKIDLDKTLIILNTEFGRTATRQNGGSGRNHWPHGYVTAFIGGPITSAQRGIHGAIGPDSLGDTYISPAENRIAALLALGIWPYSPEAFAVSDTAGASSEMDAALTVTRNVLGYAL